MRAKKSAFYILGTQGFTIVELLVAVGVMGIVAMGLMNLTHFFQKESRSALLRNEITYFDRKISQILANAKNCEETILSSNPVIPLKGSGLKAQIAQVKTYNEATIPDAEEKPIVFNRDTNFSTANRLDKQLLQSDQGATSQVWIKNIWIKDFVETDYAEDTTDESEVSGITYGGMAGEHKQGWAVIEIIFAVRQLNGTLDENGDGVPDGETAKYFTRKVKAEYPVAIVIDSSQRLVGCVDSAIRSSASALESLCVDLGGSVTFRDGKPECYGTLDKTMQIGRRTLCANFGGYARSKEAAEGADPDEINVANYDCVQQPVMYQCDESKLQNTTNMEFKCAVE